MVSSIYTSKRSTVLEDIWKFACVFYPTIAMTANILWVLLIIYYNINIEIFHIVSIKYIEASKYNFLLNLFLHLIIPIYILNYYLILWGDKYINLVSLYRSSYNKTIITVYLLISILGPIIYLLSQVEIRW